MWRSIGVPIVGVPVVDFRGFSFGDDGVWSADFFGPPPNSVRARSIREIVRSWRPSGFEF